MGLQDSGRAQGGPGFNLQHQKQKQDRKGISALPFQNAVTDLCAEDRVYHYDSSGPFQCRLPEEVPGCTGTAILVNCFLPV